MLKRWSLFALLGSSLLLGACQQESASNTTAITNADEAKAADTAQVYNWKMVTTWPPSFPVFQQGVEKFTQDLDAMSGGRLKVKVFAGGELVPPLQTFDAVSQGTVQMGHGAAYYWAGKVPAAQFMTAVPFGMTAKGMNSWFYQGGGLELWREMYEPFNLVPYPAGNSGVQMAGWFNKKIESIDDLKGLKMRIPGLGGKVLAKAGGTPVLLAGSEIYTALERGTIDATEWVGPFHDERLGLYRAAQYYYYPGWHEPGTVLELIVNKEALASLPADLQKMVEIAAQALNQWMYSEFEGLNIKSLRDLAAKPNVEVIPLPEVVLDELRRLTKITLTEEAEKDPKFKKIYEAFKAFQADHQAWTDISDGAYYDLLKSE
ncbi:TRAP transporter substrate-binding protein DctP [Candidatus Albibeggiatoa sp. nov. BB20]|uniref:TRAP transporter substrate-binding protein n=1 Tax=Candidatus Albibeggiatoa sp. nov. BB20 TaxID=3162723 RepID=UPI003365A31E